MENGILEVAGNQYKIGKLDAFKQFHVSRRLAPVVLGFSQAIPQLVALFGSENGLESSNLTELADKLSPMVEALATMSDEDSNYVLTVCLGAASRQTGNGWQKVYVQGGGFMFQDIDMLVMVRLLIAVLGENLGNFISALPGSPRPST